MKLRIFMEDTLSKTLHQPRRFGKGYAVIALYQELLLLKVNSIVTNLNRSSRNGA